VLWDLDPQGAATYILRGVPNERASARKLVRGKRELPELVAATSYDDLYLVPADRSYRNFDVHMSDRKNSTSRLLMMSRSLHDDCDLLRLDCTTLRSSPPRCSLLERDRAHDGPSRATARVRAAQRRCAGLHCPVGEDLQARPDDVM